MHLRVHRVGYQRGDAASLYGFMGDEWTEWNGCLSISLSLSLSLFVFLFVCSEPLCLVVVAISQVARAWDDALQQLKDLTESKCWVSAPPPPRCCPLLEEDGI
jgi:hypothetical protein